MTVTWVPSVFVTCTSYAAAAFELSFSVFAASGVPPTFATAAAFAFVAVSPVSGVSGVREGFAVVEVDVVVAFVVPPAPKATAAPMRPQSASTATPAQVLQRVFFIDVLSWLMDPRHTTPREAWKLVGDRCERCKEGVRRRGGGATRQRSRSRLRHRHRARRSPSTERVGSLDGGGGGPGPPGAARRA